MKIVLILMGSLLTACARPKSQLERPYHLEDSTDPTRSRPEFKYVDGHMPVPPEEPLTGTRIGWSNMPDPNTYQANGKKVYKATKVKFDTEREIEAEVYVEANTDVEFLDSVHLEGS